MFFLTATLSCLFLIFSFFIIFSCLVAWLNFFCFLLVRSCNSACDLSLKFDLKLSWPNLPVMPAYGFSFRSFESLHLARLAGTSSSVSSAFLLLLFPGHKGLFSRLFCILFSFAFRMVRFSIEKPTIGL